MIKSLYLDTQVKTTDTDGYNSVQVGDAANRLLGTSYSTLHFHVIEMRPLRSGTPYGTRMHLTVS